MWVTICRNMSKFLSITIKDWLVSVSSGCNLWNCSYSYFGFRKTLFKKQFPICEKFNLFFSFLDMQSYFDLSNPDSLPFIEIFGERNLKLKLLLNLVKGQFNWMFPQFNKNWKFHCLDLMSDVSYLYLEMKYENSECQNGG